MIQVYGEGPYTVAENQVWVEGVYTTKRAARLACRVHASVLGEAWDKKCPEPLTEKEIEKLLSMTKEEIDKVVNKR